MFAAQDRAQAFENVFMRQDMAVHQPVHFHGHGKTSPPPHPAGRRETPSAILSCLLRHRHVSQPPAACAYIRGNIVNALFLLNNCGQIQPRQHARPRDFGPGRKNPRKAWKYPGQWPIPSLTPVRFRPVFPPARPPGPAGSADRPGPSSSTVRTSRPAAFWQRTRTRPWPICSHCRSGCPASLPGPGARRGNRCRRCIPHR